MTKQQVIDYVKDEYGVAEEYLWKDGKNCVLRHKGTKKWFGVLMLVEKSKFGFQDNLIVEVLNVKVDPILKAGLLGNKGNYPVYHMNKTHWISIILEEAEEKDVKLLIDMSFDLTKSNR